MFKGCGFEAGWCTENSQEVDNEVESCHQYQPLNLAHIIYVFESCFL